MSARVDLRAPEPGHATEVAAANSLREVGVGLHPGRDFLGEEFDQKIGHVLSPSRNGGPGGGPPSLRG